MTIGRGVSDSAMIGGIVAGALFGVLIGTLFSVVGLGVVYEAVPLRDWLYKWQTLLSGALAAFAGALIFYAAVHNERKAAKQEELEARVLLPFSLSLLNMYLANCLKVCEELYDRQRDYVGPLNNPMPILDGSIFVDIRTLIRLSNKDISRVLSVVMADLQIVDSSIREMHKRASVESKIRPVYHISYLQGHIYQLAYLKVVVDRFFSYSREMRDYDFSLVSREDIKAALHICEIFLFDSKYSSLADAIEIQVGKINDPRLGLVNSLSALRTAPRSTR